MSTAFGEILPEGVEKYASLLDVKHATTLFDLGAGRGKLAMQLFLTYRNLKKVVGVELGPGRAEVGLAALKILGQQKHFTTTATGSSVTIVESDDQKQRRSLEFREGNLFHATDAFEADVVVMETAFPT